MKDEKKQIEEIKLIIDERCEAELGQVHASSMGGKVTKTVSTKLIARDIYEYLIKDSVVLSKEEYEYLKSIEKSYDPFWFCSFGGCEGARKECKDTCEMSIFVKERKETAEKAFDITKKIIDKKYAIETPWTRATLSNIINQIEKEFAKQFDIKIKE